MSSLTISKAFIAFISLMLLLVIASCDKESITINLENTTASNILNNSASISSHINYSGESITVSQHGHCWSTIPNPDISREHSSLGVISSDNDFTSILLNLKSGSIYYVRPYATVNGETFYGDEISFLTVAIPIIITKEAKAITETSAIIGGNVLDIGASEVITRGICWSILQNPTIDDNYSPSSSGNGEFESELTGLSKSTIYFARAYATNSSGTAYGNELIFMTLPVIFSIGQYWEGGIIFYVDSTGQHGLISSTKDQNPAEWGCYGTYIGGTSTAIGTGHANTKLIVKGCSEKPTAARTCDELILNGYSDWFLPSIDELSLMFEHRNVIGDFIANNYYSSSERNSLSAYRLWGSNGQINYEAYKNYPVRFRAVRAF